MSDAAARISSKKRLKGRYRGQCLQAALELLDQEQTWRIGLRIKCGGCDRYLGEVEHTTDTLYSSESGQWLEHVDARLRLHCRECKASHEHFVSEIPEPVGEANPFYKLVHHGRVVAVVNGRTGVLEITCPACRAKNRFRWAPEAVKQAHTRVKAEDETIPF